MVCASDRVDEGIHRQGREPAAQAYAAFGRPWNASMPRAIETNSSTTLTVNYPCKKGYCLMIVVSISAAVSSTVSIV